MDMKIWELMYPKSSLYEDVDGNYKGQYKNVEFLASGWYATGTHMKKIDNITLRLGYPLSKGKSFVELEGTADNFEGLIKVIRRAIETNQKMMGITWEELKAGDRFDEAWKELPLEIIDVLKKHKDTFKKKMISIYSHIEKE